MPLRRVKAVVMNGKWNTDSCSIRISLEIPFGQFRDCMEYKARRKKHFSRSFIHVPAYRLGIWYRDLFYVPLATQDTYLQDTVISTRAPSTLCARNSITHGRHLLTWLQSDLRRPRGGIIYISSLSFSYLLLPARRLIRCPGKDWAVKVITRSPQEQKGPIAMPVFSACQLKNITYRKSPQRAAGRLTSSCVSRRSEKLMHIQRDRFTVWKSQEEWIVFLFLSGSIDPSITYLHRRQERRLQKLISLFLQQYKSHFCLLR